MHPPFYIVDHRIDPETRAPWEERAHVRRGGPARLDLSIPYPGSDAGFALIRGAIDDPPARAPRGGGFWQRLRAAVARRPRVEPVR